MDMADNDGWTPLHFAALRGHVGVICELLNKGTCVDIAHIPGLTPLNLTSGSGYVISVRELLTCFSIAHIDVCSRFIALSITEQNIHVSCCPFF